MTILGGDLRLIPEIFLLTQYDTESRASLSIL